MTTSARREDRLEPRVATSYVLEHQVGFLLRKAQQRATEHFNAVMGGFGVTPTQFAVMAKLDDLGPTSQNQLGRLVAMDPASIFSVVGRLAKRGWVSQSSDVLDGRLVIVALTSAGSEAARDMRAIAGEVSSATLEPLTHDEARAFLSLIVKLG
ncbi:MAG: MarR family winged helix-turn-helix transcriptional regulator [Bosea sp. (in: a-proteobacteria)]